MKVFIPNYSNEVEKRVLKEKEMKLPEREYLEDCDCWACTRYRFYLFSLQTIPFPDMTPEFGKREEVVEGRDFELQYQKKALITGYKPRFTWILCSKEEYNKETDFDMRRIIAIAIEGKPDRERGVTVSTGSRFTPSYDLFMSGGNTDDEKAWFELGYKAAKKEAAATPTAPASSVEQRAKEYAESIQPDANATEAPYTTTGDIYEIARAAYLAGHSSKQPGDGVEFGEFIRIGFTVDDLDEDFRWRRVVTNDQQDSDSRYTTAELYSLFKQRGKE